MEEKRTYKPEERIGYMDRKNIRICILTNFKNYSTFCKKYPVYNCVYISNIITGRLSVRTEKYEQLLDILVRFRFKEGKKRRPIKIT